MAFIDFSQPLAARDSGTTSGTEPIVTFDPVEWQVVALTVGESLSSLREPGWLSRVRDLIFGRRQSPKLANDRLEALRRLAVEARYRGYAVSLSALAAFRKAGFSTSQLELLLTTISADRHARGRG
jgi:hypothetical protein